MLVLAPAPAAARLTTGDPALTYVQARAAAIGGDHARAAQLLAAIADARPDQLQFAQQALTEAVGSGQMELALELAAKIPPSKLAADARMLLVTEALKQHQAARAIAWLPPADGSADLRLFAPLISAWDFAERGDQQRALAALGAVGTKSPLRPLLDEQQALILLKFRRPAEAEPYATRAVATAGGGERRLRLVLADGFLRAGDRARAAAMVQDMPGDTSMARQRVLAGRSNGQSVDSAVAALSDVLTEFSADLARMQRNNPPIGLAQVAHYADPKNSAATALLAILLDASDRSDEALQLLAGVPADDPLISQVRDVQTRILSSEKRYDQAYALAADAVRQPGAASLDFSRLGDVLAAMNRPAEAAQAYGQAIALNKAAGAKDDLWTLLLLRANSLQEANRWPEAKAVLQEALLLAPQQPLLLNFLGYAQLERGEDLDAAEAMIRKASEMAPDDASITDSLGWALFKRGKLDEAIHTLARAAEKDPDQAEIQEHLGDALYKSGRRFEARFAWHAALVTAEDEVAGRVKAKLASGLTTANAAP